MQQQARAWKKAGVPVAVVPTMGYLHGGHLSLVVRARKAVGPRGKVVVSIYVNPTQFAPTEDLKKYPRDLSRDKQLCRGAGVVLVFTPSDKQVYPEGFSTYVVEEKLSKSMEGASRPTHFRGVCTVVAKLFNIVAPDIAVFGAKDFQQASIVQRMARDLNFPLKVIVAPTLRERDGLAMSSRNKFLTPDQRAQATVLNEALHEASATVKNKPASAYRLKEQIAAHIATRPQARLDYVEFFDPKTLEPVQSVKCGTQMALAVFFGKTRLIDNATL
ncbi:MAG: pantothenate synthetase [Verrucomicrobiales bacterium]|nr:pantothenate synthetase [Verrucomicrobiales bacterium]